jgi:hypothetical protein
MDSFLILFILWIGLMLGVGFLSSYLGNRVDTDREMRNDIRDMANHSWVKHRRENGFNEHKGRDYDY